MCRCALVSVRMYVCVCVLVCNSVSVLLHYILGFSTSCTLNNSEGRFACCPRYTFAPGLIVIGKPHFSPPLLFTFAPPSRPFATHLIVRFVLTAAQLRSCALLNFLSELSFFLFFLFFNFLFLFLFYVVIPFNVCAAHLSFLPSFHCPRQGQRRTGKDGRTNGQLDGHSERPSVVSK